MKSLTLDGESERELEAAVAAIEAVSSAEVVVALVPRVRSSIVQHVIVAAVVGIGMLAFTLYSPIAFRLWHVLTLPVLAAVLGGLIVEAVPALYRFLLPAELRSQHVYDAACAAFIQRGVHATRDRTGILVFIALREHCVEVVGDLGVREHVGAETLIAWSGILEGALPAGAKAIAKELAGLAPDLAKALPRRADDIDELANGVQLLGARPRQQGRAAR
jgi:putative membrane protein